MEKWQHMTLLTKEEVKYCIKKLLEKESFWTKKYLIGALHHTTITRYMRHFKAENPIIDNKYRVYGKKRVDEHNSEILKELYKEGFLTWEEYKGEYKYRGKKYKHFILKLK